MNLKLEKPIVFFDLETTGTQVAKDRIVEIAILKVFPNGKKESKTWLVNPTIPIPPETTEISEAAENYGEVTAVRDHAHKTTNAHQVLLHHLLYYLPYHL